MNWIKRYIHQEYEDFWTDILDEKLGVDINNREKILSYGSEYFTRILDEPWESQVIKKHGSQPTKFLERLCNLP